MQTPQQPAHAPTEGRVQGHDPHPTAPRLLITAGPTQEPIDAVRFIGNRSSGTLGIALAQAAADRGWPTTLLLGPVSRPTDGLEAARIAVHHFRTTADLESLLTEHASIADVLVMAAAVADYRPAPDEVDVSGKRRRTREEMVLKLEPTPDVLAGVAASKRPDQTFVGFALEPRSEMLTSARRKLDRKRVDLIVANPLETMDAKGIEATLIGRADGPLADVRPTPGVIDKSAFAVFLLDAICEVRHADAR
ncbi:MAG: phosphopantothenoylcysteine decarboxylase [Planctomycetota bacterium]